MLENALAITDTTWLEIDKQFFPLLGWTPPTLDWAVLSAEPGGGSSPPQRLGDAKLGELSFSFSPAQLSLLPGWVEELGAGRLRQVDLQVLRCDGNGKTQESLHFSDCSLSGLHFPACAAADKTPYLVKAVFHAGGIVAGKPGEVLKPALTGHAKAWLGANFRLTVGSLPTRSVSRIEAFSLTRELPTGKIGETRDERRSPSAYGRCSPLCLSINGQDYPLWRDFALQQLHRGEPGTSLEAQLELLDPSLKTALARFELRLLGLAGFRLAAGSGPAPERLAGAAILPIEQLALKIPG